MAVVKIGFSCSVVFSGTLQTLFYGVQSSDCPVPCTSISTETKLVVASNIDRTLGLGLFFHQTVQVIQFHFHVFNILKWKGK